MSSIAANASSVPRSDACVLHVDCEAVADGVIMNILNAGVRWMGDPLATNVKQKQVGVVRDAALAFSGEQCLHVWTDQPDQRGRIVLQRRYDAPDLKDDVVAEFVFRATASGVAVDLDDFVLWTTAAYAGLPSGIALRASGTATSGTYDVDVQDAGGAEARTRVARGIPQSQWMRFILHKHKARGTVELWLGEPGEETLAGEFRDIKPQRDWGRVEFGDTSDSAQLGSGYWDDIRIGNLLSPGGTVAPGEVRREFINEKPEISYPILVGREKQLFVDDVLIQSQRGVKRTLHPLQKHPQNPLLSPELPHEIAARSLLPLTIHRDAKSRQFKLWYAIWGKQVDLPTLEAYAISDDGIAWKRPNLGLYELEGSTDNNILREGRMFRVVPHPDDPDPAKRYKAIIRDAGFLAGYSPDGLNWETSVPVLDQSLDASSVHWDPAGKKFIASCKIFWDGKRARGYAESADFENWTDTYLMLKVDERDGPTDQLYAMHIARYESVYVGILKVYHLDSDRCDLQLAFSRDGRRWQRPDRTPFVPNGANKSDWDYGNIDDCSGNPIVMDDRLRFYYSGRSTLHNELPNDGAMGMGTLRIDGFMSIDADAPGVLTTHPVRLAGEKLFINANATGGEIRVELLDDKIQDRTADEADVPILPHLKSKCAPIKSDSIRHEVTWNGSSSLEAVEDRPLRIRFHLKNAKLYSFWSE